MSALADAALGYAARGWSVLPLEPRGKRPAGALVPHGLHDASGDPDRIAAWWKACPSANVGLRTGAAFDVVDIDGPEGRRVLMDYMAAAGLGLGSGPWAWTGGDGDHLLYLPSGAGNRAGILPNVDYRGAGGYIVAAPSVHPSGRAYAWKVDDARGGPDEPLKPLPGWLVALVMPARVSPPPRGPVIRRSSSAYARRALEGELGRLAVAPVGQRNDQLNRSAFALGQLVGGGVLDAREVVEALAAVAERIGLGALEAEASIRSGLGAGMARPRDVSA